MLNLSAKIRKEKRKKTKKLRQDDILHAVLYGPKLKNISLEVNLKEFEKIYKEAGETLISLDVEGDKKYQVLIHDVQYHPLTGKPIHVDFYQPLLTEEVETTVPLIFEGEAPAVKILGGTLVKNISEIEVRALPQKLPKEIKINIEVLKTFEDSILIKDLKLPEGVKTLKNPDEIVALVVPPEKVEEELEKPIEERVEEVERIVERKEIEEL